MKQRGTSPEQKDFIKKIIVTDLGLFLLAGIIAVASNLYFGIVLFGLGLIAAVIGAYLAGPNQYDPNNPRISRQNPFEQPSAENLRARVLFAAKNSVPVYAFENALLLAGLIAILVGLLILFL